MYLTTATKNIKWWSNVRSYGKEQEVYYPLALFKGCWVVERHLEMANPTKSRFYSLIFLYDFFKMFMTVFSCGSSLERSVVSRFCLQKLFCCFVSDYGRTKQEKAATLPT